jgi:hypothetical protein
MSICAWRTCRRRVRSTLAKSRDHAHIANVEEVGSGRRHPRVGCHAVTRDDSLGERQGRSVSLAADGNLARVPAGVRVANRNEEDAIQAAHPCRQASFVLEQVDGERIDGHAHAPPAVQRSLAGARREEVQAAHIGNEEARDPRRAWARQSFEQTRKPMGLRVVAEQ